MTHLLSKKAILSLVGAIALTVSAQNASATTIDFDSIDASGGPVTGAVVTNYLASYGITASNLTPGSNLYVADVTGSDWSYLAEPSSPNILTLWGPNAYGNSFTLNFSNTVDDFSFSVSGFLGAYSPNGNILGDWTATAYDASDAALGSVGEPIIASYGDIPMQTYTLGYSGISYITFSADAHGFAGQQMPLMDDFTFTSSVPEPGTLLLLGSGMAGLAITRRLRKKS